MGRSTYAIRSGFEYQDLYCANIILQQMLTLAFDVHFDIESDGFNSVDDLVLRTPDNNYSAHQVKFHVDQDYVESFESLTAQKTPKSGSMLQKLYRGWSDLRKSGTTELTITFVSSNPPERGRFKLGPVIDTRSGRLDEAASPRDGGSGLGWWC